MYMHMSVLYTYLCIMVSTVSIVKICLHVQCMFRGFIVYVHVCEVCIIILWNLFASVPCCCGEEIISRNRQCGEVCFHPTLCPLPPL